MVTVCFRRNMENQVLLNGLFVCLRVSSGTAQGEDSAEHEDPAQAEALHMEVSAGLCRHWT